MTEQRYQAVLAVVGEGRTITEVAAEWRVSRQTLQAWLLRYEAEGLEGVNNKPCRATPKRIPSG